MTSNVPSLSGDEIRAILHKVKTIAVVGASANPDRPSYEVAAFLLSRGYEVTAVNPGLAGQTLLGAPVVASLKDLAAPVDMVDIFRNSAAAREVVTEILALNWRPSVIWMQLGVVNETAAALARAQGIMVIMNRCPKIDYIQLGLDQA
ncbi:CoA-binding protein [Methylocella silvestris]|uniref:CoA-binding protein n=1 Tax=Methylocella silvestris TaxID=199596 RepID=A0A2J7TIX3_METSI|nr:CoA-binding protein [Methylocella silvestris]PNG26718.1 CoA-binding protein [Methylocella silvestris]